MFEVQYAPSSQQRRDNWSRETVRALRRKVKNLKAQIETRNLGIKERDRTNGYWKRTADYWRRKHTEGFGEMSAEQYRMTQRMAELTADLSAAVARADRLGVENAAIVAAIKSQQPHIDGRVTLPWAVLEPILAAAPDTRGHAILDLLSDAVALVQHGNPCRCDDCQPCAIEAIKARYQALGTRTADGGDAPSSRCVMCRRVNPPCGWSTVTFGLPGWRCHDCIDRFYARAGQEADGGGQE